MMKTLRVKIQEECRLKSAPQSVIEKDYALSYILAGISKQPMLSDTLIFKGGTALKKLFFGDYRFSEDLDFSVCNAPKDHVLENALQDAINTSAELLSPYGCFQFELKRYLERVPHPLGQEAFNILVKFPWHRQPLCAIKIEVTHDEALILAPEYKSILHGYGETLDCLVACYPIDEIIAEKLRAILQTHKKLMTRGWCRPRARDYYDLWSVIKKYGASVDIPRLITTLEKKCRHRDVLYKNIDDFFTKELVTEAANHWEGSLSALVKELPDCQMVLAETRDLIQGLLTGGSP